MLADDNTIFEDMLYFRDNYLIENDFQNNEKLKIFIKELITKYGNNYVDYLIDNNIFERYLNWTTKPKTLNNTNN